MLLLGHTPRSSARIAPAPQHRPDSILHSPAVSGSDASISSMSAMLSEMHMTASAADARFIAGAPDEVRCALGVVEVRKATRSGENNRRIRTGGTFGIVARV